MRSPQPALVVIACPHCGTRYQLPAEAIGTAGRKVACASCGKAWLAEAGTPPPRPRVDEDRLFAAGEEEALDRDFIDAERATRDEIPTSLRQLIPAGETPPPEVARSIAEIKAAVAVRSEAVPAEPAPAEPPASPAAKTLLERRQQQVVRKLPAARLFRMVRIAAVALLVAVLAGGIALRTEIVRLVPEMAGIYAALGLGVNVVGLEFADIGTVVSHRGASAALTINATIHSVEPRRVMVPPIVVSLLDTDGATLYQWSVTPRAADIEPGEVVPFSTELVEPPKGAVRVRLGFADGRPRAEASLDASSPAAEGNHP